jgi:hypothetical protein
MKSERAHSGVEEDGSLFKYAVYLNMLPAASNS